MNRQVSRRIILICLIILSVVLMVVGIAAKQPDSVMAKAINICLECIGIG